MQICPGCGRSIADRAPCVSCPAEPPEHRGSRMPDLLREAAASGFPPLTEGEKEAFKQKLEEMGAVIHGGRR
jgi:hypothetical protein